MQPDAKLAIHIDDAARYVANASASARYDLIMVDAYLGMGIAGTVSGEEFYAECQRLLAPQGILVLNLWGSDKRGLRTALAGVKSTFSVPSIKLPAQGTTNVILLAFNAPPARELWRGLRERAKQFDDVTTDGEFTRYAGLLQRAHATRLTRLTHWVG